MKHVRVKIIQASGSSVWNIIAESTAKAVEITFGLVRLDEPFVIIAKPIIREKE